MKHTQKQLVALAIAANEGWTPAYTLGNSWIGTEHIGSEADRRAIDVLKEVKQNGYFEVDGKKLVIDSRRNGKYKEYKLVSKTEPLRYTYQEFQAPDGTWKRREVLVN